MHGGVHASVNGQQRQTRRACVLAMHSRAVANEGKIGWQCITNHQPSMKLLKKMSSKPPGGPGTPSRCQPRVIVQGMRAAQQHPRSSAAVLKVYSQRHLSTTFLRGRLRLIATLLLARGVQSLLTYRAECKRFLMKPFIKGDVSWSEKRLEMR